MTAALASLISRESRTTPWLLQNPLKSKVRTRNPAEASLDAIPASWPGRPWNSQMPGKGPGPGGTRKSPLSVSPPESNSVGTIRKGGTRNGRRLSLIGVIYRSLTLQTRALDPQRNSQPRPSAEALEFSMLMVAKWCPAETSLNTSDRSLARFAHAFYCWAAPNDLVEVRNQIARIKPF